MIDCHSHLTFLTDNKIDDLLKEENKQWILGGYDPKDWIKQKQLVNKYPQKIQSCFGLHPWFVLSHNFNQSESLKSFKEHYMEAHWIGEAGLDFFKGKSIKEKDIQIEMFEAQLEIAKQKPFVFHIVQAHAKALEILKNHNTKGFVHSFSGSFEVAKRYYEKGILLSFGPNLLSSHFKKVKEALEKLPLTAILIESDTPSGQKDLNSPTEIYRKVLKEVAKIKKIDEEEVTIQVAKNLKAILRS